MIKIFLLLTLIIPFYISGYSQKKIFPSQKYSLQSLIDIVVSREESDTVSSELPISIIDIVSEYYAESTIPDTVASNVLSYLEGIYREHGYYENGDWSFIKDFRNNFYQSYTGKLPKLDECEFELPVNGSFTSKYGYRPRFGRFHRGIDISLNIGDTVKCALPGVVTTTGYEKGGYGRYIIVTHSGGIETLYGHLHRCIVSPGQRIDAGEAIGLGGSTGNSTGPHLHFETRYRGVAVNPSSLFEKLIF